MQKYQFRSALDDPPGFSNSSDPFDVAYRKARLTQGDLETVTQSTVHNIIRALNDARDRNLWFLFPTPKPCLTPRGLVALLAGATVEDFVTTVRTLAPDKGKKIEWLMDPSLNDEDAQLAACLRWCSANGIGRPKQTETRRQPGRPPKGELSHRELADHVGKPRETVRDILAKSPVRTNKTAKTTRQIVRYEINSGTRPVDAASRIRKTFGDTFADALKAAL